MRLFEAIIDANHRAIAGDKTAGVRPSEFADSLPVAALTCMDRRLNPLIPEVLGLPEEDFIWVRNAGNIVSGPVSCAIRSLAVACLLGGAKEVAVIGHTNCMMRQLTVSQLLDLLASLGVQRSALPENVVEFFGIFASERENVIRACQIVRRSPLISPRVPVHGLMVDLETGRLEWLVNGYESVKGVPDKISAGLEKAEQALSVLETVGKFAVGPVKFGETKLGEIVSGARSLLDKVEPLVSDEAAPKAEAEKPSEHPTDVSAPPPLQMRMRLRKDRNRP
ncbi:MAG: hypothetical protein NZ739_11750 [Verrucomicrobiae bacterium]|nr:hypothetical protein [Verrucomicrobiae bacterium]MCX7722763.1 hypothetical protein [Verrucomicrobiae bacterium]MDW7980625.1 carbonic anhydrase [Verrucomicrobiales bacterium]